ncbi:pyridoxamine 5'-phosphate oxidase family protein [Mumia sp. zg.B21]|uniref:pyridoxamine 5'-phosphate oxidase family protein n=1 Tax=unclassified Mumia TaxID=2621872 RepID=UPI001C6F26F0|nr:MULTISPECIES: pyridoxamine 5'-phosphate oxidase family protein [unclassified Mumia]MBW9211637.1 pyridoxamine 5'-phosphate oxidase family protein [Mumia sp. zg.B21]MDD9349337.1 pyridoxamine 5'-phosphate oxidase family protein [Mumia sp.]
MTDEQSTLLELLDDLRIAMFTTVDIDGTITSRPMARQQVEPSADMWFITARDSRQVAHITARPHVGITFSSPSTWVSLNGTATVVDDPVKLEELWNTFAEAWMPEGPDDPNVVLIRVDLQGGEYWDTPGGRVASLISLAKAKITGNAYDGADNERVDL